MTIRNLILFSSLLSLTVACGGPEADWVYGSWTEELSGETIEFSQDKKVRWFNGAEGTFSFAKNDEILCLNRCPDGILVISVDGQTFRTPFRTDSNYTDWAMEFQNRGGIGRPRMDVLGTKTSRLMLRRAGPGIGAFDVPNFTRVDQGLEALYANMSDAHVVNGQIVGSFWSDGYFLAKFDNASNRWNRIESPTWTSNAKFGGSVIRFDNDYSLDNGETWRDAPSLSDAVPNVSFRAERFLGTKQFQIVDQPAANNEDWSSPRPHSLYVTDLAQSNPAWTKAHDFSSDFTTDRYYLNLQVNETLNELYVTAHEANSDGNQAGPSRFLVSRDQGASFQEESIPASFTQYTTLKAHAAGVLFTSYDFETKTLSIHTYTSATQTWTLATAQDNRLGSLSGDNGFIDGQSIVGNIWGCGGPSLPGIDVPNTCSVLRVGFDGAISVVTEVPALRGDGFQTPHLTLVNGELFLSALTLWRLNAP